METIKWIHWFWITLICVVTSKLIVGHPLDSVDIEESKNITNLSLNDSSATISHKEIQLKIDENDEVFVTTLRPDLNVTSSSKSFNKTEISNPKESIISNNSSVIQEIHNFTKENHNNNNEDIYNSNEKNHNKDIPNSSEGIHNSNDGIHNSDEEIHNNNASLSVNSKLENLDLNNDTSFISTNNKSIEEPTLSSSSSQETLILKNINSNSTYKKSLTSQEDPVDNQLIQKIPSKLIKSDTFLLSTTTIRTILSSSLDIEQNFTNLTNNSNFENSKRKSKGLSSEYRSDGNDIKFINYSTAAKNLLIRSAESIESTKSDNIDEGNVSSQALSHQTMDPGLISGICFAVFGLCCGIAMTGLILYRRRYLNKPHALSEPDSSSGYIDDSIIRDNSDELYSLDNDSFLNSLEAMTIQNYWSETVKHTKL